MEEKFSKEEVAKQSDTIVVSPYSFKKKDNISGFDPQKRIISVAKLVSNMVLNIFPKV